jgi:hypothetical protein
MSQGTKRRKQAKILTTIETRYTTDHYGPRVEENEGQRRIRGSHDRAEILKYVVTIRRNNVLCISSS